MRCRECGFEYVLSPEAISERAKSGYEAVAAAVATVPASYQGQRQSPAVWSVNAYVAHLADAAEVIHWRINAITTRDRPSLPNHDQEAAVERTRADERPTEESLPRLAKSVEAFRQTIVKLPAEAWDRVGVHSVAGDVRLRDLAHDMPHELTHHAADIRAIGEQVRAQAEAPPE